MTYQDQIGHVTEGSGSVSAGPVFQPARCFSRPGVSAGAAPQGVGRALWPTGFALQAATMGVRFEHLGAPVGRAAEQEGGITPAVGAAVLRIEGPDRDLIEHLGGIHTTQSAQKPANPNIPLKVKRSS
jgi:hypothetical protein